MDDKINIPGTNKHLINRDYAGTLSLALPSCVCCVLCVVCV